MRRVLRAVFRLYPRRWRERYEEELGALVEQMTPGWRDAVDVARAAVAEQLSGEGRRHMLKLALGYGLVLGVLGLIPVLTGTMTRIQYPHWLWLEHGAAVILLAGCGLAGFGVSRQTGTLWEAALAGLLAGVLGRALPVACLLAFSWLFADSMVQYPYEHYDYLSRGAGSVRDFLNIEGMRREVVSLNMALSLLVVPVGAGLGLFGAVVARRLACVRWPPVV